MGAPPAVINAGIIQLIQPIIARATIEHQVPVITELEDGNSEITFRNGDYYVLSANTLTVPSTLTIENPDNFTGAMVVVRYDTTGHTYQLKDGAGNDLGLPLPGSQQWFVVLVPWQGSYLYFGGQLWQ